MEDLKLTNRELTRYVFDLARGRASTLRACGGTLFAFRGPRRRDWQHPSCHAGQQYTGPEIALPYLSRAGWCSSAQSTASSEDCTLFTSKPKNTEPENGCPRPFNCLPLTSPHADPEPSSVSPPANPSRESDRQSCPAAHRNELARVTNVACRLARFSERAAHLKLDAFKLNAALRSLAI